MERGSDKHTRRLDEAMKGETAGIVSSGHDTHAEEWKSAEPSGEDQPEVSRSPEAVLAGGTPKGMDADDVEARSQLAQWLPPSLFPAVGQVLLEHAQDADAPEAVVAQLRALPAGREYDTFGEAWRDVSGGRVESERF